MFASLSYVGVSILALASVAILVSAFSRRGKLSKLVAGSGSKTADASKVIDITSEQQFNDLLASGQPVLIKFSATWCPACNSQAPIFAEVSKQYDGKVGFYNVDYDKLKPLAKSQGVRALPTLIFYKAGTRTSYVGFQDSDELKALVDRGIKAETK